MTNNRYNFVICFAGNRVNCGESAVVRNQPQEEFKENFLDEIDVDKDADKDADN